MVRIRCRGKAPSLEPNTPWLPGKYRGTALTRKRNLLGPYSRTMLRVPGES